MIYGTRPKYLGIYEVNAQEMFHYTYLPIKFPGSHDPKFEKRLNIFSDLIGRVCCDFVGDFGLDRYVESYLYLTAKNLYQKKDNGFNRPGWHSDGFGTDDICYLWSNKQPTIFNTSDFDLTADDQASMIQMSEQAHEPFNCHFLNSALLRLDQYCIHKVGKIEEGVRCFVKLCFSKDKYDLIGNSHNYELDYDWPMRARSNTRNVPQEIKDV